MKILLAGPGTGKTTKIRELVGQFGGGGQCLILSFTNATVNDLLNSLSSVGVSEGNCMTLHKFAVKYNHDVSRHILFLEEELILKQTAKQTSISFLDICDYLHATTFDQMIDRFVSFAKTNRVYLEEKLTQFKYLIVDEYQDFNPHEQALIDLLLPYFSDSIILGDDDQCIYDFKDASNEKIINLFNDSLNEKIDHEHKCFRCPDKVVEHATNLIINNKQRVDKKWLKSGKNGHLIHVQKQDLEESADYVLRNVKRIQENDSDASIFVLAPVGFVCDPIKERFLAEGIDFEDASLSKTDPALIEKTWEVRSLFGSHKYLNLFLLGYRKMTQHKLLYSLLVSHLKSGPDYNELFEKLSKKLPDDVLKQYGNLSEMLSLDVYGEVRLLYDNAEGKTEEEKLERLFLKKENADSIKKIRVMSIHKSKGLGAEYVFIVGLTEGILPNKKDGIDSMESQRRVFYVGMTRAKKCLCLISVLKIPGKFANRVNKADFQFDYKKHLWNGRASRFIDELKLKP